MALEDKLDVRKIVQEAGMSSRPEFYSGRGAIRCDLNSEILQNIYGQILSNYGEVAAQNYVRMVADIPKLSATDFLNTLYSLAANDWKWKKKSLSKLNGMDVGPDNGNGGREAIAMATIGGVLFGGNNIDETFSIRNSFLSEHGIKTKNSITVYEYFH